MAEVKPDRARNTRRLRHRRAERRQRHLPRQDPRHGRAARKLPATPASPPPASTSACPSGQMGNSEVGHTNIGAGRVVFQDLPKISREVDNGDFFKNPAYLKAMADAKASGGALHVLGLLSDGGVHSHITHIFAILDMAKREGLEQRLRPLLPRRPRRQPHLRRGLRREPPGQVRRARQREDRHHPGPLLGHGPRQALGARAEGLRRHCPREGRYGLRPRAGRQGQLRRRQDRRVHGAHRDMPRGPYQERRQRHLHELPPRPRA